MSRDVQRLHLIIHNQHDDGCVVFIKGVCVHAYARVSVCVLAHMCGNGRKKTICVHTKYQQNAAAGDEHTHTHINTVHLCAGIFPFIWRHCRHLASEECFCTERLHGNNKYNWRKKTLYAKVTKISININQKCTNPTVCCEEMIRCDVVIYLTANKESEGPNANCGCRNNNNYYYCVTSDLHTFRTNFVLAVTRQTGTQLNLCARVQSYMLLIAQMRPTYQIYIQ